MQRDVLRGTGGTAYFLKRQDILSGTATLLVEFRDPVTGRVVEQRRLSAGSDYRIDYLQGVVFSAEPLRPGLADSTLTGADILWQRSDTTWLKLERATSEGLRFGTTSSLNGGLTIDDDPTAGRLGQRGTATRIEGRLDLAEFGYDGYLAGYDDRKTEGFTSPDYDVAVGQRATGLEGRVRLGPATELTFAHERFSDDEGQRRTDDRVGVLRTLTDRWTRGVEVARTDRANPGSTALDDNGTRTDTGARLTYAADADTN